MDTTKSILMNRKQVARRLGISVPTWGRWVRNGDAPKPVENLPGQSRWRSADIEALANGDWKAPEARDAN